MKVSVSIATRGPKEARYLVKKYPGLPGNHSVPIRELLSESFLLRVGCTSAPLFHDQLSTIEEEDKAALDDLANHFTSIPTFGELASRATGDWVLAKLKQKGIGGTATVKIKAPAPSQPVKPTAPTTPPVDTTRDQPAESKDVAASPTNGSEEATPKTNDDLIFERLQKLDPLVFQFTQEKRIRLTPRPKWSWAFEWMRTTFDVEERSDSSGTYYAFLYSPSLSDYQKLTYLISTIRADKGFKEWLEARQIVERRPSTISPAPGTPEFDDYQKQLDEQQDAEMAEQGATPGEISSRRWLNFGNDLLGPQGLLWEILNAAGTARQVSRSARRGMPGRWAAKPPRPRRRQPAKRLPKGVQANRNAGNAARDTIAAREAPASKEHHFKSAGGSRFSDVLKEGKEKVVIESKVGLTSLSENVRRQLARDWWLRHEGKVDRVIWEFTRSKTTGQVGPNGPLRKMLEKLGFEIRINP